MENKFIGKLRKTGDSLMIVVPKNNRDYLKLNEGDWVEMIVSKTKEPN